MSLNQNSQVLHGKITDSIVAAMVANALRIEHTYSGAAVKRIARLTGASLHSVSKWYQGLNTPKAGHLLMLAKAYPNVLRVLLEIIDQKDVWNLYVKEVERNGGTPAVYRKLFEEDVYRVKFVPINVVVDSKIAVQLNQRQLWFLGRLQSGGAIKAPDIENVWGVSAKTAKRDIAGLKNTGLIKFVGARKDGYYALK